MFGPTVRRWCRRRIAFYQRAFGATERLRLEIPGGKLAHAEIQIGDSVIGLCDPLPQFVSRSPRDLGGTSAEVWIYVDDVDAAVRAAVDAGATLTNEVSDQFWGDRSGIVTDPFGHVCSCVTRRRPPRRLLNARRSRRLIRAPLQESAVADRVTE